MRALEEDGYESAYDNDPDEFRVYVKAGCNNVPVNPNWTEIYDDDPIFRVIRRDLGVGRRELLARLNRARQ